MDPKLLSASQAYLSDPATDLATLIAIVVSSWCWQFSMPLGVLAYRLRTDHPVIVQIKPRDMRLGPMERWKECGPARVGCAKARMGGSYGKKFFEFFLCRHGSPRKSQADIHGGELTCVATGRRIGGRICCLCIQTWLYR